MKSQLSTACALCTVEVLEGCRDAAATVPCCTSRTCTTLQSARCHIAHRLRRDHHITISSLLLHLYCCLTGKHCC